MEGLGLRREGGGWDLDSRCWMTDTRTQTTFTCTDTPYYKVSAIKKSHLVHTIHSVLRMEQEVWSISYSIQEESFFVGCTYYGSRLQQHLSRVHGIHTLNRMRSKNCLMVWSETSTTKAVGSKSEQLMCDYDEPSLLPQNETSLCLPKPETVVQ